MPEEVKIRIRHATHADIPTIVTLEREAETASHWSLEQYESMVADSGHLGLVLEDGSGVQGFLIGTIGKEAEVENVVVATSARRQGLGGQLLEQFVKFARQAAAEEAFLEVRESNVAARSLYEKAGFVESGRRKEYYRDPREDAILYKFAIS